MLSKGEWICKKCKMPIYCASYDDEEYQVVLSIDCKDPMRCQWEIVQTVQFPMGSDTHPAKWPRSAWAH